MTPKEETIFLLKWNRSYPPKDRMFEGLWYDSWKKEWLTNELFWTGAGFVCLTSAKVSYWPWNKPDYWRELKESKD
jgi:hypothetical protein